MDHPNVQEVIRIAEDIMKKNQVLNLENLYHVAKRSLKLPRNGLLSIIQFLINKKILIEGTKFSKKTVLMNRNRQEIHQLIQNKGAVHFSHIRKIIKFDMYGKELSSGQLIWHLEMLIKFNHIKKVKFGNYSVFLPIDVDEELGLLIFILNDEINKKILETIVNNEPIKRSELYGQISEKRENVYYHLNLLFHSNIIIEDKEESDRISINSTKEEILKKMLKEKNRFHNNKYIVLNH
jgi:predicted transcriptional regulator